MSIDFGPSSIKKYYDKDGKLTKTEEPVESSYCSGEQTGPNCIKVQEYNYWGRVSKTYYEWSFYA